MGFRGRRMITYVVYVHSEDHLTTSDDLLRLLQKAQLSRINILVPKSRVALGQCPAYRNLEDEDRPELDWPDSKFASRGSANQKYHRKSKWVQRRIGRRTSRTRVRNITTVILWILYIL
jgi:hypothetical protein